MCNRKNNRIWLIVLAGLLLCGCGGLHNSEKMQETEESGQAASDTGIVRMEDVREALQQDKHEDASAQQTEYPAIASPIIETDIHSISITRGHDGARWEISRTVEAEAFWEIVEKFEALEVEKAENQTPTTGYTYWLRMYDEAGEELHSISPQGENIEIDNVRYQDYEKGTAARLFLAVDALCGERKAMGELTVSDRQELDTVEGVTMEVTYATSMGANLLLTNTTDKRIVFGDDYSLQTKMDGTWYEVGYIIDNWAFPSIGYEILNGDTRSWSTRWQIFHGELEPGDYRIVKSALDSRGSGDFTKYYLGAEFVVK